MFFVCIFVDETRFFVMRLFRLLDLICLLAVAAALAGCNKDDEFYAVGKPVIEFDHADGIYAVSVGQELTLAPEVENGEGAEYTWTIDGEIVGREPRWTHLWTEAGEYYVLLTVRNSGGTDREEVRVDVTAPLPPAISLAVDGDRLQLQKGTTFRFCPLIGNLQKGEKAEISWMIDGQECSDGQEFEFVASEIGTFNLKITARASGGESSREIVIDVVEHLPARISFVPLSMTYDAAVRYTVVGRPVALQLITENVGDEIVWAVDGVVVDASGSMFVFPAERVGVFDVSAAVGEMTARMSVEVVDEPAGSAFASASALPKVLEWMPAPGQFIGETSSVGGMTDDIITHAQACEWAQTRLAANRFVSLGAWGGYIVMSLDGSIGNSGGGYDFAIMGNAIPTSNEPGIVWVMQDVNGNGLPDDQWYELRGSDFNAEGIDRNYRATYYRPAGMKMAVQWSDACGNSGIIDYIGGTHNQPTYYPAWINEDSYTLFGCRLPARNAQNPVTGLWTNDPFEWGYVDNLGSDLLQGDTQAGLGQWVGFRISNAVLPDGRAVNLSRIDFIKVQTAIMARSGQLGELSTEVAGLKVL